MEFKGKISTMFRDMVTRNWNITISTEQDISEALQTFSGKELDVELKQHREKRSLNANAYYWCLLTKLAKVHGWTNAEAHNRMLREYGQFERVEGQLITVPLPDTDQTEKEVLNKMESSGTLSEDYSHEGTDKESISSAERFQYLQHRRNGQTDQRTY